jgi:hypothetical protein
MSTVNVDRIGYSDTEMCLAEDPITGSAKAWVTIAVISGVPSNNNTFNISSTQDIGTGLYRSLLSVTLPGSNGARFAGTSHVQNTIGTSFNLTTAIYESTGPAIRIGVAAELTPQYVSGFVF